MAKTLSEYSTIVQKEVDDTSTLAAAIIEQNVKEIYQEVLSEAARYLVGSTTEEIAAVIGVSSYTPTDFTDILTVHYKDDGDYMLLTEIPEQEYLELHVNDEPSRPYKFYINNETINLVPAPSSAGTIRVTLRAVQPELTGTSLIPDRFTDVIKLGATYRYQAWDKDPSAIEYQRLYMQAKERMMDELSTRGQQSRPKLFNR